MWIRLILPTILIPGSTTSRFILMLLFCILSPYFKRGVYIQNLYTNTPQHKEYYFHYKPPLPYGIDISNGYVRSKFLSYFTAKESWPISQKGFNAQYYIVKVLPFTTQFLSLPAMNWLVLSPHRTFLRNKRVIQH